jgi:hypothetical protein
VRLTKQAADDGVVSSGFETDGATDVIVLLAEQPCAFGERPCAEIRTAGNDDASGFADGVGLDEFHDERC